MLTPDHARVGAKVAMPTQKTAGVSFEHFDAEMNGCTLEWDSVQKAFVRVKKPRRRPSSKAYALPYLVIDTVGVFADTQGVCITLKRADGVDYLGADTFADEDLELYNEMN